MCQLAVSATHTMSSTLRARAASRRRARAGVSSLRLARSWHTRWKKRPWPPSRPPRTVDAPLTTNLRARPSAVSFCARDPRGEPTLQPARPAQHHPPRPRTDPVSPRATAPPAAAPSAPRRRLGRRSRDPSQAAGRAWPSHYHTRPPAAPGTQRRVRASAWAFTCVPAHKVSSTPPQRRLVRVRQHEVGPIDQCLAPQRHDGVRAPLGLHGQQRRASRLARVTRFGRGSAVQQHVKQDAHDLGRATQRRGSGPGAGGQRPKACHDVVHVAGASSAVQGSRTYGQRSLAHNRLFVGDTSTQPRQRPRRCAVGAPFCHITPGPTDSVVAPAGRGWARSKPASTA